MDSVGRYVSLLVRHAIPVKISPAARECVPVGSARGDRLLRRNAHLACVVILLPRYSNLQERFAGALLQVMQVLVISQRYARELPPIVLRMGSSRTLSSVVHNGLVQRAMHRKIAQGTVPHALRTVHLPIRLFVVLPVTQTAPLYVMQPRSVMG